MDIKSKLKELKSVQSKKIKVTNNLICASLDSVGESIPIYAYFDMVGITEVTVLSTDRKLMTANVFVGESLSRTVQISQLYLFDKKEDACVEYADVVCMASQLHDDEASELYRQVYNAMDEDTRHLGNLYKVYARQYMLVYNTMLLLIANQLLSNGIRITFFPNTYMVTFDQKQVERIRIMGMGGFQIFADGTWYKLDLWEARQLFYLDDDDDPISVLSLYLDLKSGVPTETPERIVNLFEY